MFSDHSPIHLSMKYIESLKGPGLWKINNSLFNDREYSKQLTDKLVEWKNKYEYIEIKNMLWDLVKYKIRDLSNEFSKQKARQKSQEEKILKEKLNQLEQVIGDSEISWAEYEETKFKLKAIINDNIKGQIVRSRIQWSKENETNSAYFFGLEKNNYTKKILVN